MRRLDTANIVILAQNLNPSIFTEKWLVDNSIIGPEGAQGEYLFSPMMVQVPTQGFHLAVVPERLQLEVTQPDESAGEVLERKVGAIVDLLPHTPFRAIGFNFHWVAVTTETSRFAEELRARFAKTGAPLYEHFDGADARFGVYLSTDVDDFRLRLEVKPLRGVEDARRFEGLAYAFNFHSDLSGERPSEQVKDRVRRWPELLETSRTIFDDSAGWVDAATEEREPS